jgi:hypothetical protein
VLQGLGKPKGPTSRRVIVGLGGCVYMVDPSEVSGNRSDSLALCPGAPHPRPLPARAMIPNLADQPTYALIEG